MSFRCELCGKPALGAPTRVITHRRDRTYSKREKVNPPIERLRPDKHIRHLKTMRRWRPDDPGGAGWETVKEAKACSPCSSRAASLTLISSTPPTVAGSDSVIAERASFGVASVA